MKISMSGGAGDLGVLLARDLEGQSDLPMRLDIRAPRNPERGQWLRGSILDREILAGAMKDCEIVVHIAAWHGIHLVKGEKKAHDFWDLNVTGTFNVFEQAAKQGINKFIFISSTSVQDRFGVYGHTKVLGEEIARAYHERHAMNVIVLRPGAFIPYWNREAYRSFSEWARWYFKGAVHISDVCQAVLKSVQKLKDSPLPEMPVLFVDGKYEYNSAHMNNWDAGGPGTTFKQVYRDFSRVAEQYEIDITAKPEIFDIQPTQEFLAYEPGYSFLNVLQDLEKYGEAGPPLPNF
jgi:nucleoside-diphosphate-sugar epimerase